MRYLIIEDEQLAYDELKRLMQRVRPDYQPAGWACSVAQAVGLLKHTPADLLLMDIRLSDGLCFDIFEQISPLDTPVIFTTAYDEYAIKAFKVNSIDYLLKPVEESDLEAALHKLERQHTPPHTPAGIKQLELEYLSNSAKTVS